MTDKEKVEYALSRLEGWFATAHYSAENATNIDDVRQHMHWAMHYRELIRVLKFNQQNQEI